MLCSVFAKALAKNGYAVALIDLNAESVGNLAREINNSGGKAKGYGASVLDKAQLEAVHEQILADFGKCTILLNGAGGNNPKGTTAHEKFEDGDDTRNDIALFSLDEAVRFISTLTCSAR